MSKEDKLEESIMEEEDKIQFFTIQFQLNLSGIKESDKKNAEYLYKLEINNQKVHTIFPEGREANGKESTRIDSKNDKKDDYIAIKTWEYREANGEKSNRINSKNYDVMSTKPTLIQFITKAKNDDFEITFRINYPNRNSFLEFEPLINDGKIIPNTSYALYPKKDGRNSDSILYVILNLQKSFDVSLYPLYRGSVIDGKDPKDIEEPKYYEIYFKNQDQEYILYRSEIRDKKYRWSPFNFRYLNLANPQIFIRFFYHEKSPQTPTVAPTVTEYISFSCKSNSYKDFFKYKSQSFKYTSQSFKDKSQSIASDEYIEKCCDDQKSKNYFIFPFIKKSPLNIQKVKEIKKINANSRYLFIDRNNATTHYDIFYNLSKFFMDKIGFGETESDLINNKNSENNIYSDMVETIKIMVSQIPKCCNWASYNDLINDAEYNEYLNRLSRHKRMIKRKKSSNAITFNKPINNETKAKNDNDTRAPKNKPTNTKHPGNKKNYNPGLNDSDSFQRKKNKQKGKNANQKNNKIKRTASLAKPKSINAMLKYQVLFIYDYVNESDTNIDFSETLKDLNTLLGFYPEKTYDDESYVEKDIFSFAGKQMKNINQGIYNLGKDYNYINKKKKDENKERKQIELYSGYPLIIVTLIQKSVSNPKFEFWKSICNQYSFIKLICIKEKEPEIDQYNDKILLNYLAELKCIYDIFVKWTSQINFTFPVQMKIDPTSYSSLSLTPETISESKNDFIRRRLLELLSFNFDVWSALKGHFSAINFYSWKNPASILALRDKKYNPRIDHISKKVGQPRANNVYHELTGDYKEQTYATILAAATAVLYHHRGGDPYAEPCFIFALNWIKTQGLVDSQNNLMGEMSFLDIILNVNQEVENLKGRGQRKVQYKKK